MSPAALAFIVVPAIGFPLLMQWMARRIEARIATSHSWPTTPATITYSEVGRSKGSFYPVIRYSYEAGGKTWGSQRYCFGGFAGDEAAVVAMVAAHPVGAIRPAYHDPQRPGFSVLERTGQAKGYRFAGWLVGGLFLLTGLVLALSKGSAS